MAGNRVTAYFGALEVQVRATMTRSPGPMPDVGELVWRDGGPLPGSMVADLVFYNGAVPVVTFSSCQLTDPRLNRTGIRSWSYSVRDRRWKWEWPTLFGEYNVRDKANVLVAETSKTPRELAELCLDALGETGYNVSALPTDAELAPHVQWHYTPAAAQLQNICEMFGCEIHLLNDDTVSILQKGVGTIPNNVGLEVPPDVGLLINPAPDNITAFAGDTLFDDWLYLDACGMELDGTVRCLPKLSYAPAGGWENYDPTDDFGEQIYDGLSGSLSEAQKRATVAKAVQTVFRMYRVCGFSKSQAAPPGYPDAMPTVVHNTDPDDMQLVDILTGNVLESGVNRLQAFQAQAGEAVDTVMQYPLHSVFDPRVILPLFQTRLLYGDDLTGESKRRPPEICGVFEADYRDTQYEAFDEDALEKPWLSGFSVDAQNGYVILNRPAYQTVAGGKVLPALLYLRIGFGLRLAPYGNRYHRQYNLATGNSLGTANGIVPRPDIETIYIRTYVNEYKPWTGSSLGSNVTNVTAVDTILQASATEYLKSFQNLQAPTRKQYTPLRAIDTDGAVQQVQYSSGDGQFGRTVVSIGTQYDAGQPTAKQKRQRFLDKQKADEQAKNFATYFDKNQSVVSLQAATGMRAQG